MTSGLQPILLASLGVNVYGFQLGAANRDGWPHHIRCSRASTAEFGSKNLTGKLVCWIEVGRFGWFPPRSSLSITVDSSSLSDVPLINNLKIPSKCVNKYSYPLSKLF